MKYDLCIIGAGSGGLSLAAGAAQMGATVALVEAHKMGGDCLNYGCVPSKSLIAAAKHAHAIAQAPRFGLPDTPMGPVSFAKVRNHIQDVIAQIAPHDSVERFESLGVKVYRGTASFIDKKHLRVNEETIRAKYFCIASGSKAIVPEIPGLSQVPYLTNETIFELDTLPRHLIVIGGGPIGVEMSQAFRRLGAQVSLLTSETLLPKDDPELVTILRERLRHEGINIIEHARATAVAENKTEVVVDYQAQEEPLGHGQIQGSHLFVAAGRRPALAGLDLEKAKVKMTKQGIEVNRRLRTTNRRIYAIGDCIGQHQFTHAASYHASIVVRNLFFKLPGKVRPEVIPWVTYTDPELAHAGFTHEEAVAHHGKEVKRLAWSFADNDRARAERRTEGKIIVSIAPSRQVLGASIIGLNAGELILPWVEAITHQRKINALATTIVPYPTLSEVTKRVSGSYFTPKLFSASTQRIVRFIMKWLS